MKYRIGIDLGGTKTEIMLTGANPLEVLKKERVPTERDKGYRHMIDSLAGLIKKYLAEVDGKNVGIGLGMPGSSNPKTGRVICANTTCLIGEPFQADLEAKIGHKIFLDNDANCFALSEAVFGAGQGFDRVFGVIMGTGCGGGIVESGKVWKGAQGIGGEWGHSTINYEGPECWCGNRGCLELYLSGSGAEREYFEMTGNKRKLADIYQDYKAGKGEFEAKTMQRLFMHFGLGIGNLITSYDPDILVIGGGVSNIPELYTLGVEQVAKRLFDNQLSTPIVQNKLGDSSGIYGAALLCGPVE